MLNSEFGFNPLKAMSIFLLFLAQLFLWVTAEPGTAIFKGRSGRTYAKDIYISDVDAALVNWDAGAGASATSPTDWVPPEAVYLMDLSIVTGNTVTTKLQAIVGGLPTGDMLREAIHLTTLANRPNLVNVVALPGQRIQFIQRA